jgi:hypothetical protein
MRAIAQDMTPYKFAPCFENEVLWKRPYLRREWCIRVLGNPIRSEPQEKHLFVRAALSALGVLVTPMRSATALHVIISLHGAEISPPT